MTTRRRQTWRDGGVESMKLDTSKCGQAENSMSRPLGISGAGVDDQTAGGQLGWTSRARRDAAGFAGQLAPGALVQSATN